MNGRKLAMIGALFVVLVGCVIAAGCTDNAPVAKQQDTLPGEVLGIWGAATPSGVHGYYLFYQNGTGMRYVESASAYIEDPFVWNVTDAGYDAVFDAGGVRMRTPFQLDADKDTLIDSSGLVLTKQQQIPPLQ